MRFGRLIREGQSRPLNSTHGCLTCYKHAILTIMPLFVTIGRKLDLTCHVNCVEDRSQSVKKDRLWSQTIRISGSLLIEVKSARIICITKCVPWQKYRIVNLRNNGLCCTNSSNLESAERKIECKAWTASTKRRSEICSSLVNRINALHVSLLLQNVQMSVWETEYLNKIDIGLQAGAAVAKVSRRNVMRSQRTVKRNSL